MKENEKKEANVEEITNEKKSLFARINENKGEYLKKAGVVLLGAAAMAVGAMIVFGEYDDDDEDEDVIDCKEPELLESSETSEAEVNDSVKIETE